MIKILPIGDSYRQGFPISLGLLDHILMVTEKKDQNLRCGFQGTEMRLSRELAPLLSPIFVCPEILIYTR